MFCPVCRSLMTHTRSGFICKNSNCPSRNYSQGDFVTDLKNPQMGVGRVVRKAEKGHYLVSFKSGTSSVHVDSLERHVLQTGTMVKTSFGQGIISDHSVPSGELYYQVLFPSGVKSIKEELIEELLPANPIEKMKNGDLDTPSDFSLRILARFYQIAQYSEDLICIWNSRVDLLPHQVGVTHRVVQEYSPRFLLADEVGLGKTMEAGLVLKELKARGLVNRTLILTPASLVTQWQYEMRSKFNERFEIFDSKSEAVYRANNPDQDVFSLFDNVLCSIHYAKNRVDDFANQFWDMVIFDEAHHIRRRLIGRKIKATKNYRFAEAIKDRCSSMLLLTATPMQLDPFEFYSLIELLDPTLFKYYELFDWYNERYSPTLKKVLTDLKNDGADFGKDEAKIKLLKQIIELGEKYFLPRGKISEVVQIGDIPKLLETEGGRKRIERYLENFFVVRRLMLRNRKREVFKHLPKRIPKTIGVDYTEEEVQLYEKISEYVRNEYNRAVQEKQTIIGFLMVIFQKMLTSSRYALLKSFRKRLATLKSEVSLPVELDEEEFDELDEVEQQEIIDRALSYEAKTNEIQILADLCKKIEGISYDSKIEAACEAIDTILEKDPKEKILIFTQFIGTQEYLRDRLSDKYDVVIFNGQMSKEEKDENTQKFKESAQIMISTEAGGEGRNFQFCHIMINYDLPWNPMKIEQRIGRLDRIGQKKNVMVYNFTTIDTVEQRVLEILYERVERFRQIIGDIEPILGDLEQDVKRIIMSQHKDLETEFKELEKTIDEKLEDAEYIQSKIEDFLMDTRQFNFETVEQILSKKPIISPESLKEFVKNAILNLGDTAKFNETKPNVYTITLPLTFRRNKCRNATYTGTFDQSLAREREELEFFAFGHELVSDLLWHYSGSEFEPVCTVLKNGEGIAGYLFLYFVEIKALTERNKIFPVVVTKELQYDERLSDKLFGQLEESIATKELLSCSELGNPEDYHTVAESRVASYIEVEIGKIKERHDLLMEKEMVRVEQLFQLRRSKFEDDLKKETEQYQRIKNTGDEKQMKILPAIDGRIKKLENQIEQLDEEKKDRLETLEKKGKITSNYTLLGLAKLIDNSKYDEGMR